MALPSIIDEIERLFDELIQRPWGASVRHLQPAQIRATADGWLVEVPVEGLRIADLTINIEGRRLLIHGRRHAQRQQGGGSGWMRIQRQKTNVHQAVTLPEDADPDSIEAKLEGAVLSIHVRRRSR